MGAPLPFPLPPPHYRRGHYCQWVFDRRELPWTEGASGPFWPHIQWRGRGEEVGEEHWGHLEDISLSDKLQLLEDDCPKMVLFDWAPFEGVGDEGGPAAEWRPFFTFSFPLIPRLSLFGDRIVLRHYGRPPKYWPYPVVEEGEGPGAFPRMIGESQIPNYNQWEEAFSFLQDEFSRQHLQKVALSRKKVMFFSSPFPHQSFFCQHLPPSPKTYHILLRPSAQTCFCSLSPERLFLRKGQQCLTEAIAGSQKGGQGGQDLLASHKDRYEHDIVVAGIEQDMGPLSLSHHRGEMEVLDLSYVQHLRTPLTFKLRKGVTGRDVLGALHPTGALGGRPKERAMEFIRGHGIFERGLYGAPIGRWSRQGEEYAVGIRSALAEGDQLHLFAGAGVVPQSLASAEWRETENKMECFR